MKQSMVIGWLAACAFCTPLAAQGFGTAVAAGADEVIVGQSLNDRTPGYVYVYRRAGDRERDGAWAEAQRLEGSDAKAGDRFGRFVALDGASLLVGSTVWNESRGVVYAFERDGRGQWRQTQLVTPDDVRPGDAFGRVAARDGDVALVSTWGHAENRGAVYVLRRDPGGRWAQEAKLMAEDAEPGDWFGMALDVVGDMAVVGAPRKDGSQGVVYVFRRGTGGWTQAARIEAAERAQEGFGYSVLLAGDALLVGVPGADEATGRVDVFRQADGVWARSRSLVPFDGGGEWAQFGTALARAGDDVWVAAPNGGDFEGRIYVLERKGDEWVGEAGIGGADLSQGAQFGAALDAAGDVAAVGVPNADFGVGAAKVLERSGDAWRETATLASVIEPMQPIVGGQVDCSPDGRVADLFPCQDVELLSFLPVEHIGGTRGVEVNDVWGWTDPSTGREYAIVGRYDGTSFLDVTDAHYPRYLGNLPLTDGANPNVWRDMKVYRDHTFIVADGAGEHGMQVFDLTRLRDVREPREFTMDAHYAGIHSAHNIVIDTVSGFAFAVGSSGGGQTCGGGLHMIDIRTPLQPTFAGCFSDPQTGRASTGYSHDAQCVTYDGPDTEHRGKHICFGANETALSIADVTDKANPVALARASYPNVGYSHQGWLTDDGRYFYMNDELDELQGLVAGTRTLIWDVSDLDDPLLAGEYIHDNASSDHNLYIRGNVIYQSNYVSGLRILDISEPEAPVLVGYFDTVPWGQDAPGFDGSWSNYPFFASGTIVVTSGKEGVFLLKKRERAILP